MASPAWFARLADDATRSFSFRSPAWSTTCCLPAPVLVLDDYHLVRAQAVHAAVAFLLEHLPPALHLVIASREDPPLPLPRLRARHQLSEVRAADLGFSSRRRPRSCGHGMRLVEAQLAALVESLTERELEVLRLLAARHPQRRDRGRTGREAVHGQAYLIHVYRKLSVHSRTQAVARARGLLD